MNSPVFTEKVQTTGIPPVFSKLCSCLLLLSKRTKIWKQTRRGRDPPERGGSRPDGVCLVGTVTCSPGDARRWFWLHLGFPGRPGEQTQSSVAELPLLLGSDRLEGRERRHLPFHTPISWETFPLPPWEHILSTFMMLIAEGRLHTFTSPVTASAAKWQVAPENRGAAYAFPQG